MAKKITAQESEVAEVAPAPAIVQSHSISKKDSYWNLIKARGAVLYLEGKPGMAKSAIINEIAKENNLKMFDIRLSQIDEAEILGIPEKQSDNGKSYFVYALPQWAVEANKQPSIIFFDELNRASLAVRNACLQILWDKRIGHDFMFNQNVYFASAGNLGDEDNTEVEDLDAALCGRIIPLRHELTMDEWFEGYADKNVMPVITNFIRNNPTYFYRPAKELEKSFASPRSWSNLSDFIVRTYGKTANVKEYYPILQQIGIGFVGSSITRFLRYCEEQMTLSINDIIERFAQIENDLKKINRDKKSELLNELKQKEIFKMDDYQLKNICSFLKLIDADELTAFLKMLLSEKLETKDFNDEEITRKIQVLLKPFGYSFDKIASLMQ